jgi:hypothetical protein
VIETTAVEFDASSSRLSIDVRFGPADASASDRSTWLADGLGRDGSMRRAGIYRLVILRMDGNVRISAEPALILASR